jgi:hypothetical protein
MHGTAPDSERRWCSRHASSINFWSKPHLQQHYQRSRAAEETPGPLPVLPPRLTCHSGAAHGHSGLRTRLHALQEAAADGWWWLRAPPGLPQPQPLPKQQQQRGQTAAVDAAAAEQQHCQRPALQAWPCAPPWVQLRLQQHVMCSFCARNWTRTSRPGTDRHVTVRNRAHKRKPLDPQGCYMWQLRSTDKRCGHTLACRPCIHLLRRRPAAWTG